MTQTHSIVSDRQTDEGWGRAFIKLSALGVNSRWSYAAGFLRIVLYPLLLSIGIVVVAVVGGTKSVPPWLEELLTLGAIILAGAAVVQTVVRTHRRPLLSVVSATLTLDWRRLGIGAGVAFVFSTIELALGHYLYNWPWQPRGDWSLGLVVLLLTPAQAASEELVFRGYLTQALGRILESRTLIVVIVGVLFGLIHLDQYGPLTFPYMFCSSVMFSLVSLRDNRLELAIGAHTANNWVSFSTIEFVMTDPSTIEVTWFLLFVSIISAMLFYAVTLRIVRNLPPER